jgi:hypothetical protein
MNGTSFDDTGGYISENIRNCTTGRLMSSEAWTIADVRLTGLFMQLGGVSYEQSQRETVG